MRTAPRFAHVAGAIIALVLSNARAHAQVPSPTIEGPIASPQDAFISSTSFDLASVGYEQAEYFISGTATAYTNTAPLGTDGKWSVAPSGTTAAYKTRILVYRPTNPKKFTGTVVVEWLNVSGGLDDAPDWIQGHVELIRQGAVWVGVSAQFVGVEGGPGGFVNQPLKTVNPARYGSLLHPGDSFSYDIFSQAGRAIRSPAGPNPLGSLKSKRIVAIGESQSAGRLVNYVNAVHPLDHVYDGYLIHSRGSLSVGGLSQAPQPVIVTPGETAIRTDLDVPVLTFETETDVTSLGYFTARQDDSTNFRLWETAGTAHFDAYGLGFGNTDTGKSPDAAAIEILTSVGGGFITCGQPVNSGPQHYVLNAALNKLIRWVKSGKGPKSAPRLEVGGSPITISTDGNGNALGGIRTPWVDTPIATLTGGQSSPVCSIFGSTTLFDAAKLASLYPTHADFVKVYNRSLRIAVRNGWILRTDAKLIRKWAAAAEIGG